MNEVTYNNNSNISRTKLSSLYGVSLSVIDNILNAHNIQIRDGRTYSHKQNDMNKHNFQEVLL